MLNRIGDKLRNAEQISSDDARRLEAWRAAHKHVMNGFQAMLRGRTKKIGDVTIAQRHKRRSTIINKLLREPRMQLSRMDDVAGIRLIFNNISDIIKFRDLFHKSKHKHSLKSDREKYDYIRNPRSTGYRGIHDIYSYHSDADNCAVANGLMIEIQYRTTLQHAWATANEIITMTTDHRTKFNSGDSRYLEFFRLASELIARLESKNSVYGYMEKFDIVERINKIEIEIHVIRFLRQLSQTYTSTKPSGSVILQFTIDNKLIVRNVPKFRSAHDLYFKLEKANPNDDIVLVEAETFDQMRSAYRNYFADAHDFLQYLDSAQLN